MHMHMHECAGTGVREKPVTQEGNISWVISEMCSPHHVLSTMLKRSYPTPYGPSKYSVQHCHFQRMCHSVYTASWKKVQRV